MPDEPATRESSSARRIRRELAWVYGVFAVLALVLVALWAHPGTGRAALPEALRAAVFMVGLGLLVWGLFPPLPQEEREEKAASRAALLLGVAAMAGAVLVGLRPGASASIGADESSSGAVRKATILAINDVYRIEGRANGDAGGLARVRALRVALEREHDVILLHAGDVISPSLLGVAYHGRQMIDVLNLLDGNPAHGVLDPRMFVAFGNHEFDESDCDHPEVLRERVSESDFTWLASNVHFDGCKPVPMLAASNVRSTALLDLGGIKIGLFALTIDLGHDKPYPPVDGEARRAELAEELSSRLRQAGAEVVVALTHLDFHEDERLLQRFDPAAHPDLRGSPRTGPDLIIGGHDHNRMVRQVGERFLYKADADAVTASVVELRLGAEGKLSVTHRFEHLDRMSPDDEAVAKRSDEWLREHDRVLCRAKGLEPSCLGGELGRTAVRLEGDEGKIRDWQTSLGDWVTDSMVRAYLPPLAPADCAVQPRMAFINSDRCASMPISSPGR